MPDRIPANASIRTTLRLAETLRVQRRRQEAQRESATPTGLLTAPCPINEAVTEHHIDVALYGNIETSQSGIKF